MVKNMSGWEAWRIAKGKKVIRQEAKSMGHRP
jgi:hypothetical protein